MENLKNTVNCGVFVGSAVVIIVIIIIVRLLLLLLWWWWWWLWPIRKVCSRCILGRLAQLAAMLAPLGPAWGHLREGYLFVLFYLIIFFSFILFILFMYLFLRQVLFFLASWFYAFLFL